jgi:hypothetical protein
MPTKVSEVHTGLIRAGALILVAALSLLFAGCDEGPKVAVRAADGMFVVDDFESGALTDWRAVGSGAGGWFIYTNGKKAPDPSRSSPNVPFDLSNPPEGKFAAATDMNGPGTLVLYRDVKLEGRFKLHLTVFYATDPLAGGFSTPQTLAYDDPESNQQFRIDLVAPSAPIDSVAHDDVLMNVYKTRREDPYRSVPTAVTTLDRPDGTPSSRSNQQTEPLSAREWTISASSRSAPTQRRGSSSRSPRSRQAL